MSDSVLGVERLTDEQCLAMIAANLTEALERLDELIEKGTPARAQFVAAASMWYCHQQVASRVSAVA